MIALVIQNQPDSPLANLRRISCRVSFHSGSSFSQVRASGKPGAVHSVLMAALLKQAAPHESRFAAKRNPSPSQNPAKML